MLKGATQVIDDEADGGLITAVEAGDHDRAMAILIDQHGDDVYRYCRRMLGSGADSDDVSQTVFVQVFQGLKALARVDSVRSWLIAIARNRCLDRLKAVRRSPEIVPDDLHELVDDHGAAPSVHDDPRLRSALDDCLDRLDARSRAVLVLRFHDELPYDAISKLTSDTVGALRVRIARALPALRECLEAKGVAP
jgi:RNA polymerase sigma-70 factor (ECF subfamily)